MAKLKEEYHIDVKTRYSVLQATNTEELKVLQILSNLLIYSAFSLSVIFLH